MVVHHFSGAVNVLERMSGNSPPCISLPFSERLIKDLFSSFALRRKVNEETLDVATLLGVTCIPEIRRVKDEGVIDEVKNPVHNNQVSSTPEENVDKKKVLSQRNEWGKRSNEALGFTFEGNETPNTKTKVQQNENPNKCKVCFKILSNKYILARHIASHDPSSAVNNSLICNHCSKICKDKYKLKAHLKTHEEGYVRKPEPPREKVRSLCSICSKWLSTRRQLKEHTRKMHGETKHQPCSNCGSNFAVSCIKSHERLCKMSEEEKAGIKAECGQCGKKLANQVKLKRHIRFVHNHEKLFKCKLCDRKDYRDDNMKTHIKNKHKGEDPYTSYTHIESA